MSTATYNKFDDFSQQLVRGTHHFTAHVFKVALTNTAPSVTDVSWLPNSSAPPPAAAHGYPAGGNVTTVTETNAAGTTSVQGTQVDFIAAGGQIGPFRYAIVYNDSVSSPEKPIVAWFDYGSSITINNTEKFTVIFSGVSPGTIFTLA